MNPATAPPATTTAVSRSRPEVPGLRITAGGLGWSVGATVIVRGVDLVVEPGRTVGLIGPNGSGKSSLLRCLAGLRVPTTGVVAYDGVDLGRLSARERARRVAFVDQAADTDSDPLVSEVVGLGRTAHRDPWRGPGPGDRAAVETALARMNLTGLWSRRWSTLSGGQRQRAHIARAFAQTPRAVLLDEPTNHLDIRHQLELLTLLRDAAETVVVALHDLSLAARFCERLVLMSGGTPVASGTPAEVLTGDRLRTVFGVWGRLCADADGHPSVVYRGVADDHP